MAQSPLQLPPGQPCYALIVGGGTGQRMGGNLPKQFMPLSGVPILIRTLRQFADLGPGIEIGLVLPQAYLRLGQELVQEHLPGSQIRFAEGGNTRTASVAAGLQLWPSPQPGALVAVHDAVRPLAGRALICQAYHSAGQRGSGVAAVPSKSSLRRVQPSGQSEAVDRSLYYAVQTPQAFQFEALNAAYLARPHNEFTDDAGLAEAAGLPIYLTAGSYGNLKLTTPEDLALAGLLLPAFLKAEAEAKAQAEREARPVPSELPLST